MSGTIFYYWKITANDGASITEPVPVNIHFEGWYLTQILVDTTNILDSYGRQPHAWTSSEVSSSLYVNLNGECYSVADAAHLCGGGPTEGSHTYYSTIYQDFNEDGIMDVYNQVRWGDIDKSLDYLIYPEQLNSILMNATAYFTNTGGDGDMVRRLIPLIGMDLFLDPTITIDPAYADRYTLEVSYIPYVPVPEPESYLLLLAGLGVIFSFARRNNQLS